MSLGLPTSMLLVFVATILAGSLGAIHYVIVHVLLGRPFAEVPPRAVRGARDPADEDEGSPDRGDPDGSERHADPDAPRG